MTTIVFGTGYIGSGLIQELLYRGDEVIGFDNLFSTDIRAIEAFRQSRRFEFVEGSIVDSAAVETVLERADARANAIEAVYLLAAQASAHPEAAGATYTEEVNLRGPRVVLDVLARHRIAAPLVYGSSTRIYGSPLPLEVTENTPPGVFSDLSHLSKVYVEKLLEMYAVAHRLKTRTVRLGLTYGVAPVMKTDPRFMTAPNLFAYRAAHGEPLEVRSRAYLAMIHLTDAVAALLAAAERVRQPGHVALNAVAEVATVPEIAELIQRLAAEREVAVEIRGLAGPTPGPTERPIIRSAFGSDSFRPRRRLAVGLAEALDHFLVRRMDSRNDAS